MSIRNIKSMELEKDKQITFTLSDSGKECTYGAFIAIKEAYDYIHTLWAQIQSKAAETSQSSAQAGGKADAKKKKKGDDDNGSASQDTSVQANGVEAEGPKFDLTESDWEAILKGANTVTFAKDMPVVSEGIIILLLL